MVAGSLLLMPVSAFAEEVKVSQGTSFRITQDGVVHVLGAEVTSVSGSVVNAVTRLKNTVINWAFTTNASTTVSTGGKPVAALADIRVGDKLNVSGTLASLGSTITVSANKIADITLLASWRVKTGTVQSVNTGNGTFVLKSDDKTFTVATNASTTYKLAAATSTNTLAGLAIGTKVMVYGTLSNDGAVLTASKVVAKTDKEWKKELKEAKKDEKKHKKDTHQNGKGRDDLIHSIKTNFGLKLSDR